MKHVYIIHGWSGSPREPMLAWIADELTKQGYHVTAPQMPNPDVPEISAWVSKLTETITLQEQEILLVGHSIGCQTILRYLETLPDNVVIQKIILIAPWLTLQNLDEEESPEIAQPWLETPIDFEKVTSHGNHFTCFLSTNDPYVPLQENLDFCEQKLHATTIVLENRGHFSPSDGVMNLPEIFGYM